MGGATETRYARSGDLHVAYQLVGDGGPAGDVLAFSSALISIASIDDEPSFARFHRRLASFGRLIRFDHQGVGLSDPFLPSDPPTLERWVGDAIAVLDAAAVERAAVFAPGDSSLLGVLLAAMHPDRVSSLVVVNGTARFARDIGYEFGIPARVLERFLDTQLVPEQTPDFSFLDASAPSLVDDEAFRSWWINAGNRGASPGRARLIQQATLWSDVRSVLPSVQAPTLVLHRRSDRIVRVEHGRYLAANIPGARYVELEGEDDLHWVGDTDTLLDEVEEFLTGIRGGVGTDRMLATIVFTDIVASTQRASVLGDRRWREVLDRHDAALRRQLGRFGGRELNTTGDGLVALFDGPTRAVDCGRAIRDVASQLGVPVRVGIHTGEIERRGDDVSGLAVHIAARVQASAGPGEVLVSRTVVDLVVGSGIAFADRGEHDLKGVPGTWRLFSVDD